MQVSFRTIQTSVGRKPVGGALRARAAVRPALRQGCAFLLGLAGGWAVLYGALMPFGLGLTLGFGEDCFAMGAAGAALGLLARSFGALTVESICLLCGLGAAVAARWLWPGRFGPAVLAGCGTLAGSAVCFAAGTPCWRRRWGWASAASRPKSRGWAACCWRPPWQPHGAG